MDIPTLNKSDEIIKNNSDFSDSALKFSLKIVNTQFSSGIDEMPLKEASPGIQ